ncbi:MAG TPA: VCBS repeat-containing protein [Candidatus Dormibacteraeota bacterium]|jgi:hypothetical protein|nr:VCBS repeat-containing protein [Candidatus Dormibacteraeota bacterium]
MTARTLVAALMLALFGVPLSGCGGGGGSSSGGGGGGGGGGSGLSISQLSPSTVMTGLPVGGLTLLGTGFTNQSMVLVDGVPVTQTNLTAPGTLQAETNVSMYATAGTHQITVQNGGQTSNSVTLTVYTPQQGPFVMQAMPGFDVGNSERLATFIAAADVNGDGLADVIMPGPGLTNSPSIAILYGQADGTLSTTQQIAVPLPPSAVAVADVDGNGTPDLALISGYVGGTTLTVSILLGDGHGNFQPPVAQQTIPASFPGQAYLVDVDGDGQLDLVLSIEAPYGGSSSIVWLKNTGGSFAAPVTLASTYDNYYFAVADFNLDGKPDIVYVAPGTTQSIHLLLNQGNGKFHDQVAGGLNGVVGVVNVLDFNLDGIPDLVVAVSYGQQLYSFKGNGDGSFTQVAVLKTPGVTQLVTGDFDHDGFPDLAGPGGNEPAELLYFFGDGQGNFVMQAVVGPAGQYAAVGDFNGDGIPDVVVPDENNFVSLALGRTGRNFASPLALFPATVTAVSAGDINGDGLPDIMVGGNNFDGANIPGTVFLNEGNSSFAFGAYTSPDSGLLADLTGKGVVDLLGGPVDTLEIWPNNGTPDFSSSPLTIPNSGSGPFTVADMDGDGYPDIVTASGQIFYGNGSYQFTAVTVFNSNWGPYVVGDFNGDGKLDIATSEGTFLNTGGRTFQQVAANNLPLTNGALAVAGDFNGDGKADVAINLPGDPSIGIYYSNGDGTFYYGVALDVGQEPATMVTGDFNGDGQTDLAVGLLLSQQVCMLFNASGGEFTRSFFASGTLAIAMAASDLNHDGKLDLVIGNFVFDFAPPNVNVLFHK